MAENKVTRRGRNLYVIASAVLVYLFAGADFTELTAFGLRAPAAYPVVFSWAAVGALVWFWWRYLIAWLDNQSRLGFKTEFLTTLRKTKAMRKYLMQQPGVRQVAKKAAQKPTEDQSGLTIIAIKETYQGAPSRFLVEMATVGFRRADGGTFEANKSHFPSSEKVLGVKIPWWRHYWYAIPHYWHQAIRHESFADLVLPHVAFGAAIALVVCKFAGGDPAGFFGLLPGE